MTALTHIDGADPGVRPQDDLFRAVNGGWLASHEIPEDRAADGSFTALRDLSEERVRAIIEDLAAAGLDTPHEPGTVEQKIGDLYATFMDEATVEAQGLAPLEEDLAVLEAATDHDALALALARLQTTGVRGLVAAGTSPDRNDPTRYALLVVQSGLGLPDESYYRDEDKEEIREAYRAHVARMLVLAGVEDDDARAVEAARRIHDLEAEFADGHWTAVESRDAVATNNPMTFDDLACTAPGLPWTALRAQAARFADVEEQVLDPVLVLQPSAQEHLARVWAATDLEHLRAWAQWAVLDSRAPYLTAALVEESFDFHGRTLTGTRTLRERWKRGVSLVEGALGEEVGRLYVARHFPPQHKEAMDRLVADLVEAYRESISRLDWMGEETRRRALDKLEAFTPKIGYPVRWRDHSALTVTRGDLLGSVRASHRFEERRDLRRLTGPVDKDEWLMTPQTVNAYYMPTQNEIAFPAAILQPPFFDAEADAAENYGGIGAVIGHEIGHGFDDQGSRYDGTGRLSDWWTQEDREAFDERAAALIAQYDALSPADLSPEDTVNGALTVGENIGDLGGLTIAALAYRIALRRAGIDDVADAPVVDGLTAMQRFFVRWALLWRQKSRPERARQLLAVDPHSPNEFRCNQVVRNLDAFHEAFDVREGDELHLPREERVQIW